MKNWINTIILTALLTVPVVAQQTQLQQAQQIQSNINILQAEINALVDSLNPRPTTTLVPAGASLQGAIDAARPGDTLALTPGATYTGTFILRNRPTSALDGRPASIIITTAGTIPTGRATPTGNLAIVQSGTTSPVFVTEPGAHDYAFIGLEVRSAAGKYPFGLVSIGANDATQTSLTQVPMNFVIDRCYIHGDPTTGAKVGVNANGGDITITNSYIADIKGVGQDTQAIVSTNGPGPFTITNNYLEAAGENVMFGGDDPKITNLVPSDIEVSGNYLSKPLSWKGLTWAVKNVLELKNALRVHVHDNVIENSWVNGQAGYLIDLTVRNQNGTAPWSTVGNVEIDHNVIRHGNQAIAILGLDDIKDSTGVIRTSIRMTDVNIHDNLFYDIGGTTWGGGSTKAFIVNNGPINLSILHNTVSGVVAAGLTITSGAGKVPSAGFRFESNIFPEGNYGITGDGSIGAPSWTLGADPTSIFDYNLISKTQTVRKVIYPGTHNVVGTVTLDPSYLPLVSIDGHDGTPVGADIASIKIRIPSLDLTK